MNLYKKNLLEHPRGVITDKSKKAVVIGATGATGSQLVKKLLDSDKWGKITTISRRKVIDDVSHNKLNEVIIDSFDDLPSTAQSWIGNDIFFNCIGTTRSIAGSAKAFVDIEFGMSLKAAELASNAGIPNASVISAGGANAQSWAVDWLQPLLYIKTIGQKEETLTKHFRFNNVSIFRPGMLIRSYKKGSTLQGFFNSTNLGLPVNLLASSMIRDAESSSLGSENAVPFVYTGNSCIKSLIDL